VIGVKVKTPILIQNHYPHEICCGSKVVILEEVLVHEVQVIVEGELVYLSDNESALLEFLHGRVKDFFIVHPEVMLPVGRSLAESWHGKLGEPFNIAETQLSFVTLIRQPNGMRLKRYDGLTSCLLHVARCGVVEPDEPVTHILAVHLVDCEVFMEKGPSKRGSITQETRAFFV